MSRLILVRWVAQPGREAEVADILARLVPRSREEPGCIRFEAHPVQDDPSTFFLIEEFEDDAALEAHMATPHVQELVLGEAVPILVERVRTYLTSL